MNIDEAREFLASFLTNAEPAEATEIWFFSGPLENCYVGKGWKEGKDTHWETRRMTQDEYEQVKGNP